MYGTAEISVYHASLLVIKDDIVSTVEARRTLVSRLLEKYRCILIKIAYNLLHRRISWDDQQEIYPVYRYTGTMNTHRHTWSFLHLCNRTLSRCYLCVHRKKHLEHPKVFFLSYWRSLEQSVEASHFVRVRCQTHLPISQLICNCLTLSFR